jgi:hypothetical protein
VSERERLADLVRLVDGLESRSSGYLTLDAVRTAAGALVDLVEPAIVDDLLLVDHRTRFEPDTGGVSGVTVCRLNRHHPVVRSVTS